MINTFNLVPFIDDKTVLKNPHKGWYWHYFDNGMKRDMYHDRVDANTDYSYFPGLNHLYLRVDWSDIQPSEGVFDWTELDKVMREWGNKGYTFSLRVCNSETFEQQCFATPKWLYDMGCKGMFIPPLVEENPKWWNTKFGDDSQEVFDRIVSGKPHRYWEPDYGDPIFLKYLDIFLSELARKYDNDPRIEYIDLGSYGNWGEGHVCFSARKSASIQTLKCHAHLHKKYFKNKYILMNDDFINHLFDYTDMDKKELYDFCKSLGMGIRDDSIIAGNYEPRRYHTISTPYMFDDFYIQAPVDLELAHYWSYNHHNSKDGLVMLEACRRAHATYAGFHTYPEDYIKDNYYIVEYLANRLGYWYTLNSATLNDTALSGCPLNIELEWENMGFAPAYNRFTLDIKLASQENEYIITDLEFDNRILMPEERKTIHSAVILPENLPEGKYDVSVRLREADVNILIALSDAIKDEFGFYTIADINIKKCIIDIK